MADLHHPTSQFQVMPDDGITMSIVLGDTGEADIHLNGATDMPCWCGESHFYQVAIHLRCGTALESLDMNDLDGAIRGEERPARRLAWRLMHKAFFVETPPCEDVSEV